MKVFCIIISTGLLQKTLFGHLKIKKTINFMVSHKQIQDLFQQMDGMNPRAMNILKISTSMDCGFYILLFHIGRC